MKKETGKPGRPKSYSADLFHAAMESIVAVGDDPTPKLVIETMRSSGGLERTPRVDVVEADIQDWLTDREEKQISDLLVELPPAGHEAIEMAVADIRKALCRGLVVSAEEIKARTERRVTEMRMLLTERDKRLDDMAEILAEETDARVAAEKDLAEARNQICALESEIEAKRAENAELRGRKASRDELVAILREIREEEQGEES